MLFGQALREADGVGGHIATATGARISRGLETDARGAGCVPIERLPYPVGQALGVVRTFAI
jgi:hypothetical protein